MSSPFWVSAQPITHLLLAGLVVLALLAGGTAHAQTIIDVAVFYTPAAKNHQGGTEQIKTKIDEIIAATNTVYTDSGVNQQLNLVAAEGECVADDFPRLGHRVWLAWQQNSQNFVITDGE